MYKIKNLYDNKMPYFNGNADGIAFSCKVSLSPSLREIMKSINKTIYNITDYQEMTFRKELTYLVNQGVFLMNSILTVEKDKPFSHHNIGWQIFTQSVFDSLLKFNKDIIWIAWGNEAIKMIPKGVIVKNYLTCNHPSFAARNNVEWECNHFVEVNKILKLENKEVIKWL